MSALLAVRAKDLVYTSVGHRPGADPPPHPRYLFFPKVFPSPEL